MTRRITHYSLVTALLIVTIWMLAMPVLGADETTETTAPTETTAAEGGAGANTPEPAAPVTTVASPESTVDWTYRYLIPTGIVLAVLVVGVITVQYFLQVVRKRYRVNE